MVSVIVPVYNVEKYLKRCIESLLRQDYTDYEVILVDDGSKDNSGKICDEFEGEKVKVYHKENSGLSDARNFGIKKARGEYITFIDSDDFVSDDYLSELMKIIEEENCEMVQCDYEKGSADRISECDKDAVIEKLSREECLAGYRLKSQSCCKIYKTSLFDGVEFPVGRYNEDEFTTYKLVNQAQNIAFTNKKLYYYYQRPGSIMNSIASSDKKRASCRDWIDAYEERIEFFKNEEKLLSRTYEKFCVDIILRYIEQMRLKKSDRIDKEIIDSWLKMFRENIKKTGKHSMPVKRKMIYAMFNNFPYSAVVAGKFVAIRD